MDKYLVTLLLSLEQETAIKQLFVKKGWAYLKEQKDLSTATEYVFVKETVTGNETDEEEEEEAPAEEVQETAETTEEATVEEVETGDTEMAEVGEVMVANTDNEEGDDPNSVVVQDIPISQDLLLIQTVDGTYKVHSLVGRQSAQETGVEETEDDLDSTYSGAEEPIIKKLQGFPMTLDPDNFECSICGKMCGRLGSLKVHMRMHQQEKQYKCGDCGKTFTQSGHLKMHQRSHSITFETNKALESPSVKSLLQAIELSKKNNPSPAPKKLFGCSYCEKTFAKSDNLKVHERIHTGDKNFECEVCHRKFADPTNLRRHLMIHSGEKPHKCTKCLKAFRDSYHLKRHMSKHTDEQPFQCEICQTPFKQEASLNRHKKEVCKKLVLKADGLEYVLQDTTGVQTDPEEMEGAEETAVTIVLQEVEALESTEAT